MMAFFCLFHTFYLIISFIILCSQIFCFSTLSFSYFNPRLHTTQNITANAEYLINQHSILVLLLLKEYHNMELISISHSFFKQPKKLNILILILSMTHTSMLEVLGKYIRSKTWSLVKFEF